MRRFSVASRRRWWQSRDLRPSTRSSAFPPFPVGLLYLALTLIVCSPTIFASGLPTRTTTVQLAGQVVDSATGGPIAGASVQFQAIARGVAADADGRFRLSGLPPGQYTLTASAVGYRTRHIEDIVLAGDGAREIVVSLVATPIRINRRATVTATRIGPDSDGVVRIDRAVIEASGANELPELLRQVPGLYVQSESPGGGTTIRMRGSDPNQVLVQIDGVKVNAAGSGVADLSAIPLGAVETIEVRTGGGSASLGPDALAGSVNIVTRPRHGSSEAETEFAAESGRWGERKYQIDSHNPFPIAQLEHRIGAERVASSGDFEYAYATDNVGGRDTVFTGTRYNNELLRTSFFTTGRYDLPRGAELSFSIQRYASKRGLPGPATAPDTAAEAEDYRFLGSAALTWAIAPTQTLQTEFGYSHLQQDFRSEDASSHVANHFKARYLNEQLMVAQQHVWRPRATTRQQVRLEARVERLFHDDFLRPQFALGRADRSTIGLAWSLEQRLDVGISRLAEWATLNLAARYDYADTRHERAATVVTPAGESHITRRLSPRISLALSRSIFLTARLRASYGTSFRLPEINALFWRGDTRSAGNPDLRPEMSEHSELEGSLERTIGPVRVTAGATYFHAAITDLVVWQPNFQGVWQPQNIGRAQVTGYELRGRMAVFEDRFVFHYQRAITDALNKQASHTVNGNQLPFYPRVLTTITLTGGYGGIAIGLEHRRSSHVYTNEANTKWYAAYAVTDCWLTGRRTLSGHWQATVRLAADNLTDENYVLSAQYPMPGRQLHLGFGLTYFFNAEAP